MSETLLEAQQISVQFGGLMAVREVNTVVKAGEILGVIGPNGAGKSTFLNVLTGLQRPSHGKLRVGNEDRTNLKAWRMAKLGVARSFQTIRLLDDLNAVENVLLGSHLYAKRGFLDVIARTPRWRKTEEQLVQEAFDMLEWLGVGHKAMDSISNLSLQERRRVEIARALMTRPRILLLD
jgi:branched-chain amino acid transport system ATP-binding protein